MLCAQRSSPWAFSLDTLSFELGYGRTSYGVKARQMTPDAVVRRLTKALSDTLDTPSMRERFKALGIGIPPPEHRSLGAAYRARRVRL